MGYVDNIFERVELRQVCSFLLNGSESLETRNYKYETVLEDGSSSILKRLKDTYPDEREFEKAVADLSEAFTAYEEVYTEIGMKLGARIVFELLNANDCSGH
ncbi:MAG: hypothetical protein FWE20_07190 [Defluviitaleaceae bacterium]|nr:hypothetical protein [Defluviitaleaceae bacterium]